MAEHVRGNPNAKLKLVEYADFECPYCAMAYPYVKRAAARFEGAVAEIFRSFPLVELHPHALHAAQAAEAAGLQGKFWEMHDTLFENRRRLGDADLLHYAEELGLDIERFERDFSSPAVIDAIQNNVRQGEEDGVSGTPWFLLNGTPLEIDQYEDLEKTIAAKGLPRVTHHSP
jgi:protein-disulfide isomerase